MKNIKILVIIPAFNEADSIEKVILKMIEMNQDYIVVNDCSTDNTEKILKRCNANYLSVPVNLGIGGGVQLGYIYAYQQGYDIAVQMDGDGQHNPDYLKDIVEPIKKGKADIVIGSRFINREGFQSSIIRRFGINFLSGLIKLTCKIRILDVTSGFRAVNKKYIKFFSEEYAQDYPEPEAIVTSTVNGARILEVPVLMEERTGGTSSITSLKSMYYMIKVSLSIVLKRLMEKRNSRFMEEKDES